MEGQRVGENVLESEALPIPLLGGEWLAYWISQICNPPLVSTAGVVMTGYTLSAQMAWLWTTIYGLLAVLTPALYVLYLFRRGIVSDLHLTIRQERMRPLVATLGAALAAWMLLYSGGAPQILVTLAAANLLQTFIFFGITLYWKISAHSAAAAALAFLGLMLVGPMAVPLATSVLLIAWARVRLQHHTVSQTAAGAALGSSILAGAFYFWRM